LSPQERAHQGIADGLLRFSVGIEEKKDLLADFTQAFEALTKKRN
jgi:cystathionine beta-lyase